MARASILALVIVAASCGSDAPVDVNGDYTIAVTAQQNGCQIPNWTVGAMSSGIQLSIVQNPGSSALTGSVGGATGLLLSLVLGTNAFTGRISGPTIEALLTGKSFTQGDCNYVIQVDLKGQLAGDVLTGTIDFTTSTNHSPSCGVLEGCHSLEAFNGTRPPTR
jgi:hypothetical protein